MSFFNASLDLTSHSYSMQAFSKNDTSGNTKLRSGNLSTINEPRRRSPAHIENEELRTAVESHPHTTSRTLGSKLGTRHTAVLKHLRATNKLKNLDSYWHSGGKFELSQIREMMRGNKGIYLFSTITETEIETALAKPLEYSLNIIVTSHFDGENSI
uniref:Uncharacterized protein n=1 Tax=Glossina palpalis gambiensis TaxID=67801 RepID=A0A1B0AUV4_9MUSC